MKILIICTGNSCRSQMAEGFLRSFDPRLEVYSAGTKPEKEVNRFAVSVMKESFIDISRQRPSHIAVFQNENFDIVITVCDHAKEICPIFTGKVNKHIHIGFTDPADATGTDDEILNVYRTIRDQIKNDFYIFYKQINNGQLTIDNYINT